MTSGGVCDKMKAMSKIIAQILILSGLVAFAVVPARAWVNHESAVVSVMNKAAGKVQTLRVPVGGVVNFEKLQIGVRACKQTDPFDAEDFFMFVEVFKADEGQIFGGWMSRNEPGDNPLQNADYDLWLVECVTEEIKGEN